MSPAPPTADPVRALVAPHALLPGGWARDVLLRWDAAGTLVELRPAALDAPTVPRAEGLLIPGMPNLHSHAFQRAFAGLAETRGTRDDSFWGWRELMYRFALAITPDQLEDVATALYVDMLEAGYTSVCEFHYLHHDPMGRAYADPAETSRRLVTAAERAGIGLTLLPVLYQAGGFAAHGTVPQQRRFVHRVDGLMRLVERLRDTSARVGLAPHSLRAVPPDALREAVQAMHALDRTAPIHLHIAEQAREVDECLAWSGERPVQWLVHHAEVDARWCLVHATHVDEGELAAIAARGAVVGLCPTTEANLGDGLFPAAAHVAAAAPWGIGSDSHVCIDPAEELRWLEYGQRLARGERNVLASVAQPHTAERLWLDAVAGGARASGRPIAGLAPGQRADFIVLACDGAMEGLAPAQVLSSHVFSPRRASSLVRDVWVGGQRRVRSGEHAHGPEAMRRFVAAREALLASA